MMLETVELAQPCKLTVTASENAHIIMEIFIIDRFLQPLLFELYLTPWY
jgi:hypothetical protein